VPAAKHPRKPAKLTVAVTGPTGEIGRPFIRALEQSEQVGEIRGMARRPFDPAEHGWTKTTYVRGDILDRDAIDEFVAGADVVVHLAFIILGGGDETRRINVEGSRNVFQATVDAGIGRLVYTSSVAAYGFHPENPQPLTEDVGPRGSDGFYYSAQKAELEGVLAQTVINTKTEAYVFRPCIVGGPDSPALVANIPYVQAGQALPDVVRRLLAKMPVASPVLPDPGTPLQLVHADDVAQALVAATVGEGQPGVYNLAGDGVITFGDVARALGYHTVPIPRAALIATAEVLERVPVKPAKAEWIAVVRTPVVMDTTKARLKLAWRPLHSTRDTLRETVAGARASGLLVQTAD
jgi:nucleoside-diphosphate-sugar epimerase